MRVLIIGLGSIANKHIAALRKIDREIEVFAFKRGKSDEVDGIKHIYDYSNLDMLNLDFIIISNPTNVHYDTLKNIYKKNLPLFIEKPLFNLKGSKKKKLTNNIHLNNSTYVACNLRFHKGLKKMKSLIDNLLVEEVNIYCGSYLPDWRPNVDFRKVYSANKEQGGGVHIDLIHELDYLYWFFGEPLNTKSTFKSLSSLNISAYDYANYLWEYKDFTANVVLNYYRKDAKRTFEILTNKGTYVLDLIKNTIHFNNKIVYSEKQNPSDLYESQMKFFINNAIDKKNNFNTIKEAYKILELCI
jgi:predicted dehydrogenase